MTIPQVLHTPRLVLKKPTPDCANFIFKGCATDPDVTRYMTWEPHSDSGQTLELLKNLSQSWEQGTEYAWCIFQQTDRQLIGMISLRIHVFRADGGYVLAKPFWGNGYRTEALVRVRQLAFSMPEIYRIGLVCDVDNLASARVMEKAGFSREGVLRQYMRHPGAGDAPRDCLSYSYIR